MKKLLLALAMTSPISLTGCFDLSDKNTADTPDYSAFIGGQAADYSSSSLAIIDAQNPSQVQTGLNSNSSSDLVLSHYGKDFYMIYRYGANHIVKYNADAPSSPIWDCSTEGSDTNSNPYQVVQVSDSKAYILRYGTGKVWVVNPSISDSSKCATEFKTGEIDLSRYDADGIPEMATATAVNGKLYIGMQRLTSFSPDQNSQIAVIDITTDTVEQVIDLTSRNIQKLQYVASLNALYAVSVGKYAAWDGSTPAEYTGGIEKINLSDLSTQLVIDDTTDTKQISDMVVINDNKGYFISYASYQNNTLYQFNPQTGEILSDTNDAYIPVAGLANQNLANISVNPLNSALWISTTSGITTLDSETNTVKESLIDTGMNPTAIEFIAK